MTFPSAEKILKERQKRNNTSTYPNSIDLDISHFLHPLPPPAHTSKLSQQNVALQAEVEELRTSSRQFLARHAVNRSSAGM
jgi:hypothetical protein